MRRQHEVDDVSQSQSPSPHLRGLAGEEVVQHKVDGVEDQEALEGPEGGGGQSGGHRVTEQLHHPQLVQHACEFTAKSWTKIRLKRNETSTKSWFSMPVSLQPKQPRGPTLDKL